MNGEDIEKETKENRTRKTIDPNPYNSTKELKTEKDNDTQSNIENNEENITYETKLNEYNMMLDMYKQDYEQLYMLQEKFENGEIEYSEYEKHAKYMAERYEFMSNEYKNIKEMYEKETLKIEKLSPEELKQKLEELNQELTDEWNFRAHEENGLEEHDDNKILKLQNEINKIKGELNNRQKENELSSLTIEELEEKRKELFGKIVNQDEYNFRTHEENGLEGYDEKDDIDKGLKQIEDEINRRRGKKLEEPEAPIQPTMILEKEMNLNNNNLPAISFSEVLAKTQTQHISTLRYQIYKMAKAPLFKNSRNADSLQKTLMVIPNIISSPFKLIAKGVNKALKTDEMVEEMKENIEALSPEEFAVLTESSEKANDDFGRKIKDDFDNEYLNSRVMRERKINTAYLDLVGNELYNRKGIPKVENDRINVETILKGKRQLLKEEKDPERIAEIEKELVEGEELLRRINAKGNELTFEVDHFKDGVRHKTGEYKDIKGWIFAKRNPDNRELNNQMAEKAKQRREAGAKGEDVIVANLTSDMRDMLDNETKIKTVGSNINNKVDRGLASRGGITVLDQTRENKGKLLLANVAAITTVTRVLTDIHNAMEAARVNDANQNITAQVTPADHLNEQIQKATQQEAAKEMGFAGGTREVHHIYKDGVEGYTKGTDLSEHLREADIAKDGLSISETSPYLQEILGKLIKDKTYAEHGDQFSHTAMETAINQLGDGKGFEELIKALKTPIKTTAKGEMVSYDIDPMTYTTLLTTILASNSLGKKEKRVIKKEKNRIDKEIKKETKNESKEKESKQIEGKGKDKDQR